MTANHDEPLSIIRQLELMRDLQRLANERWQEENRIRTALADGLQKAEQTLASATNSVESSYGTARDSAHQEYEQSRGLAERRYEQERDSAQQQYKGLRHDVESEHARVLRAAINEQQDASWETEAVFEAIKGRPRERLQEAVKRLRTSSQELAVLERDATAIMKMRRQWREFPAVQPPPAAVRVQWNGQSDAEDVVDDRIAEIDQRIAAVREAALALYRQRLPQLFEGGNPLGLFFAAWLVAILPCGFAFGWTNWLWAPVGAGLAVAIFAVLALWLFPRSRKKVASNS